MVTSRPEICKFPVVLTAYRKLGRWNRVASIAHDRLGMQNHVGRSYEFSKLSWHFDNATAHCYRARRDLRILRHCVLINTTRRISHRRSTIPTRLNNNANVGGKNLHVLRKLWPKFYLEESDSPAKQPKEKRRKGKSFTRMKEATYQREKGPFFPFGYDAYQWKELHLAHRLPPLIDRSTLSFVPFYDVRNSVPVLNVY